MPTRVRSHLARPVFKQFLLATIALATINYTAGGILPVLRGREPIGELLLQNTLAWRDTVLAKAPWIHADSSVAMDSPQFEADKLAFAEDLMRTGQVDQKRADCSNVRLLRVINEMLEPPRDYYLSIVIEKDKVGS